MDGQIDWPALPMVADLIGITDLEWLVASLVAIRTHQQRE